MKRREFIGAACKGAAAALVPAAVIRASLTSEPVITFDMLKKAQEMMQEAEIPGPYYAISRDWLGYTWTELPPAPSNKGPSNAQRFSVMPPRGRWG